MERIISYRRGRWLAKIINTCGRIGHIADKIVTHCYHITNVVMPVKKFGANDP